MLYKIFLVAASAATAFGRRHGGMNFDFVGRNLQTIHEGIVGRVTPVGTFDGLVDSIEYFVGLAPVPTQGGPFIFSEARVIEFTSGCPEVATSTVVFKTDRVDPENPTETGELVTYLKQVAFWRFNEDGEVTHYDAYIPTIEAYFEMTAGGSLGSSSNPEVQEGLIQVTCDTVTERCTGEDQQYDSFDACVEFMHGIKFGSFDYIKSDSVVCRQIHSQLTVSRPDIHCPHTGPDGGEKCIEPDHNEVYFGDLAIFGSDAMFVCPPQHRGW